MLSLKEIVKATNGNHINGNISINIASYSMDSRQIRKGDFFIPLVGNKFDAQDYIIGCIKNKISGFFINKNYAKKDEVIKEAINLDKDICIVEVEDTERALYDIGIYNRQKHIDIPIVAITGSVGKTSTREMISSILSQKYNLLVTEKNYNSNIGVPFMLLKLENQEMAVLEVGISDFNEMEELSFAIKPDVCVITIIGTSHVEFFKTQENIFKEKSKIYKYMKKEGNIVVNGDDNYLKKLLGENIKKYSINNVHDIIENEEGISYVTDIYGKDINIKINSLGRHNIYNSLCAIEVAKIFKLDSNVIYKGIFEYRNFPRRMQKIYLDNGCLIIDDAYNSSYDSVKSGLESLNNITKKNKIVVIGDILEQGDKTIETHEKVGELFKYNKVYKLFIIGENSKYTYDIAKKYIANEDIFYFKDKTEVLEVLKKYIDCDNVIYFKASNSMNFKEIIDSLE